MRRSTERILTTHGGRLPEPSTAGKLQEARAGGEAVQAAELLRQGIVEMARAQRERGIDIMSDGEFHKPGLRDPRYLDGRCSGIIHRKAEPGEALWFGARSPEMLDPQYRGFFEFIEQCGMFPDAGARRSGHAASSQRLCVAGPLEYRGKDTIRQELALVSSALQSTGIDPAETFYPQLAPGWLGHFLFNEHYASAEAYWYALAEAWRGEYEAVVEAGFILQLDDPALADKFYMFNPPLTIEEYRRDAALRIEVTNHALRNIPEERIRYHVCWGSWHFPHTRDIPLRAIIDLLLQVKAQAYCIEASNARHVADYHIWRDVGLPEGKILIPGVVGHATSNLVESPEVVAERLVQYAKIVGRENVIAGTDCGLGGRCHRDIAWAKLGALAEGAALATQRLWR